MKGEERAAELRANIAARDISFRALGAVTPSLMQVSYLRDGT